jgi:hypothetical protein
LEIAAEVGRLSVVYGIVTDSNSYKSSKDKMERDDMKRSMKERLMKNSCHAGRVIKWTRNINIY